MSIISQERQQQQAQQWQVRAYFPRVQLPGPQVVLLVVCIPHLPTTTGTATATMTTTTITIRDNPKHSDIIMVDDNNDTSSMI